MLRDPADVPTVAYCAYCRGDIYEGDEVFRIDDGGEFVHNRGRYNDCAEKYAFERVYDEKGTITIRGEIE